MAFSRQNKIERALLAELTSIFQLIFREFIFWNGSFHFIFFHPKHKNHNDAHYKNFVLLNFFLVRS